MPVIAERADTFDVPTFAAQWTPFADAGASATVQSGRVTLTPPSNGTATGGAGFYTAEDDDLTDSAVFFSVPQVATSAAATFTFVDLRIGTADTNALRWIEFNGVLYVVTRVAGVESYLFNATYSPTTHYWWRFRHTTAGDAVHFDTAPVTAMNPPAASEWVNRHSVARPFAVTALRILASAFITAGTATPGAAHIASVNRATQGRSMLGVG